MVKYGDMESLKEAEEFILRHDMVEARAHRLALELECLLLDTKDLSIQSKWWACFNYSRHTPGTCPAPPASRTTCI